MKIIRIISLLIVAIVFLSTCKTAEQPVANFYQPVFDQTKKKMIPVSKPVQSSLDTTVLIRSNLREHVAEFFDTIIIVETFFVESGELTIPIERLNAKPPKYDTFLVANEYLVNRNIADVLFPHIPDSLVEFLLADSTFAHIDSINLTKHEIESLVLPVDTLFFNTDSILAPVAAQKQFLSKSEILSDSQRDLFETDSILISLFNDAPWRIGDSIPYFHGMDNTFLDSALMLLFDTVFVRIINPEDILPPLPFEALSNINIDTINIVDTLFYHRQVSFWIFYPDEIDLFIDMVRVAGGTFKIGSNEFDEDERPMYKIRVSSFLLSKHEVTNRIFVFFLNDLKCDSLGEFDGLKIIDLQHPMTKIVRNNFTGKFSVEYGFEDFPVVNVTWVGAQLFCKASGGRLPSEAEWEYAARGGVYAKRFVTGQMDDDYEYLNRYAGGNYIGDFGWFVDNSRGDVWAVGRKLPNELGIYDMCGNVWEWCYDKYNNEFYKANNRSTDPMCLTGPNIRVNRGGSWSSDAIYCRVTNRNFLNESAFNQFLGFRVMREWK